MATVDEVEAELTEIAERHAIELRETLDKLDESDLTERTFGRLLGSYMRTIQAVVADWLSANQ
jgi:hypothetical protein